MRCFLCRFFTVGSFLTLDGATAGLSMVVLGLAALVRFVAASCSACTRVGVGTRHWIYYGETGWGTRQGEARTAPTCVPNRGNKRFVLQAVTGFARGVRITSGLRRSSFADGVDACKIPRRWPTSTLRWLPSKASRLDAKTLGSAAAASTKSSPNSADTASVRCVCHGSLSESGPLQMSSMVVKSNSCAAKFAARWQYWLVRSLTMLESCPASALRCLIFRSPCLYIIAMIFYYC